MKKCNFCGQSYIGTVCGYCVKSPLGELPDNTTYISSVPDSDTVGPSSDSPSLGGGDFGGGGGGGDF